MIAPIKSKEKKRFVIYTRCSTDDQAQGDFTTLDAQAHHCKNMLDAFGYELADIGNKGVINDDGYSGKDLNRPGIQQILNNVDKRKKFDGIIFFRLDRLTRNPRDLYGLIDLFRDNDVDFISVRENLDSSTAIGRVVIGILGLLSAFERELTGERVKASAIARVRQGKWVGGFLPYGYKLEKDGDPLPNGRQPHKVILDKEIADRMRVIWEMAADNKSLTEIGIELTRLNVRTQHGHDWRRQTLSKIIKNPFYKGELFYSNETHKGRHEALVDEALWEKANKIMSAKLPGHGFSRKPKKFNYLLSGILKCGKCGTSHISISSTGHTGKTFAYYMCGRSKQKLGCDTSAIPAGVFDKALIDYFKKASEDRSIIVNAIGSAMQEAQVKVEKLEVVIKENETKLQSVRIEARNLLDLAAGGNVAQGVTFKTRMSELDETITKLEDALQKMYAQKTAGEMSANSGEFLYETLQFAMKHIDKAPVDAQKSLIRALIKELIIHDNHIDVKMYIGQPESMLEAHIESECTDTSTKRKRPADITTSEALTNHTQNTYDCQQWLPGRDSQRTRNRLTMHIPIHLIFSPTRALEIVEGKAPYEILTTERINKAFLRRHKPVVCKPNPITIALRYQRMYEDAAYQSMEKVGDQVGVSRVRIHQMLNLLKLDQRIIDYIQNIDNPRQSNFWNERRLRSIALLPKEKQYGKFQKILTNGH